MLDKENTVAVTLPTSLRILMPNGRVDELKLETYLAGVVATEIGASAPLESLKAQAVAARTYAAAAHRHPEQNADVCTTAHCQKSVSYTHLRAHETRHDLVCRLLLEKKK